MRFHRQKAEIAQINNLIQLCRGQTVAAALLSLSQPAIKTIADVEHFTKEHFGTADALLSASLLHNFRLVIEYLDYCNESITRLDFDVYLYNQESRDRRFRAKTRELFETVFHGIRYKIDYDYGIKYALNQISNDELSQLSPRRDVYDLIADVGKKVAIIRGLCWRLTHPWIYIATDNYLIAGLFAATLLSIPAWYLIGYHQAFNQGQSLQTIVTSDATELVAKFEQPHVSFWRRAIDGADFAFTLFEAPSLLGLSVTVLGIVRGFLPGGGKIRSKLEKFESILYKIDGNIQKRPGPLVEITIMRDHNEVHGHAAAVGAGATGTFNLYEAGWSQLAEKPDLTQLAGDLRDLLQRLTNKGATLEDEDEILKNANATAAVGSALQAAKKNDGPNVLKALASAGTWAVAVAREFTISLAAEVIEKAMGIK